MNQTNLAARKLPPVIASWDQFLKIFGPIAAGYPWAEDTIKDLWLLGSPQPHAPHLRLLIARQYVTWIEDVLNRQGRPLDEAAKLYGKFLTG